MLPHDVAGYLAGNNVLVTGVTGFVGLALVEKLLRSVPEIGTIYVLIRSKRNKTIQERLKEIKESSIFEKLINIGKESLLNKLVAVEGDISSDRLGMKPSDYQDMIDNVNYVFHCAATLDFEASLTTTVNVNLLGTRRVTQLCAEMKNLKVLLHVSSAYTNADKKSAEEKLYPAPADADEIINLVDTLPGPELDSLTSQLIKDHPNTYTFTKALAEHEVAKCFSDFATCIVRPSMIVAAFREPMPGWTNSKNGPQGFMMGAGIGVVRRLPVSSSLVYDYIPVDIVINTMILGAVHTDSQKSQLSQTPIFHCTTSTTNPFRWNMIEDKVNTLFEKHALAQAVWYPHLKLLPSVQLFRISALLFHMLPAQFFDGLARVTGGRPKLVRLHTNVNQSLERLEPFIFQEWMFDNSKQMQLHRNLTPEDQEVFGLDLSTLEWFPFFDDMGLGVRRYLHKEKDSTLPRARQKLKVFWILNILVQIAFFALIWFAIMSVFGMSGIGAAIFIPFIYMLYCIL